MSGIVQDSCPVQMVSIVRGTRTSQDAEVILVHDFIGVVYDKNEVETRQMWSDLLEQMPDETYRGTAFLFYEVTLVDNTVESRAQAMTA